MYTFNDATTQMCRISSAFKNSGAGYKARAKNTRVPTVLCEYAWPALLQIGGADTRREQKLTAGMLKSVHPCTLFNVEFLLRKNVAAAYNPGHPCPSWYVEDFSVAARMPLVISEAMFQRCWNSLPKVYKDVHFWQGNEVDVPAISKGIWCV